MAELEWSRPMVEKALMAAGGDVQKALLSCL